MKKIFLLLALTFLSIPGFAADGQAIVEKACKTCHTTGVPGAPQVGDKAAWAERMAKGMDTLVTSVRNGLNTMPPGGMCTDCSDEDYKAAIEFMTQ